MRYLIYTETLPSRRAGAARQTGIGRYCADLAAGLTTVGHEVTVLTNDEIGAAAAGPPEPYRVEMLGPRPDGRRALARRARDVRRRVRALVPDYVLVGDPTAHATLLPDPDRLAAPRCPILYGTELAAWARRGDGDLSPRALLRRWRVRRYLRGAGAIPICISRFSAERLGQLTADVRDECIVHPCVSDVFLTRPVDRAFGDDLRRRLAGADPPPLILTTVGRISERKNQLAVLEAIDRLRGTDGPAWHYVVVGNADAPEHEDYLGRLRAFACERDLSALVTFVHHATDEQKVDYLDACDASTMLSQSVGASVEGFGISAIEASARGKPVVVSDQGGMPETIVEGVTGLAVPPTDIGRVVAALTTLASDATRRRAMGEQGRRRTLEHFTPVATARRLHAQLLERRPTARAVAGNAAVRPAVERHGGQEY